MNTQTKDYNSEEADNILAKYVELTNMQITSKSKKTKEAYTRALFYKVLMQFNFMNDRQASDYFLDKGAIRNRSSIFHALSKIDMYYTTYKDFRNIYNIYFDDKLIENKLIEDKIKAKHKGLTLRLNSNMSNYNNDSLQLLINSLPDNKRDEVFEIVELRVKSWAWKSRDKCEIIESTDGISASIY